MPFVISSYCRSRQVSERVVDVSLMIEVSERVVDVSLMIEVMVVRDF